MKPHSFAIPQTAVAPACGTAHDVVHAEPLEARRLFAVPAGFALSSWASGLTRPVAMDLAPDGRAFVAEQDGAVRVVAPDGQLRSTPFATLPVRSEGERGLLGVVVDRAFASNGYVYVYWTSASRQHQVVTRFTADPSSPDVASAGSRLDLLHLPEQATGNHMGGAMHFGHDGMLYVAVGEHGNAPFAQNLSNPFGKILRINPADGSFPPDNPFVGTDGAYGGIWAYGLRNPFTFAVQPAEHGGRVFVNDVASGGSEEVNQLARGANYGWPTTEGAFDRSQYPQFTHPVHTTERGAIAGGAFYHPEAGASRPWPASYHGKYLFTDYRRTDVRVLGPADGYAGSTTFGTDVVNQPVDIDLAASGDVLVLTRGGEGTGTGAIQRIAYTASDAPSIGTQPQNRTVAIGQSVTFTVTASGAAPLSYQWQRDGADVAGATAASYTLASPQPSDGGAQFRCVVTNALGSATSNAATLTVTSNQPPTASITSPSSGAKFRAGDTISFAGAGSDPQDGTLGASAFTWRVDFHHADHTHPALPPTGGVTGGSYVTPTVGETEANVWYRVHLTVTDSGGLTHSTSRDVTPVTAGVTLATNVAGLQLSLDGTPVAGPHTFTGVAGVTRTLGAPPTQTVNGVTYQFAYWSDGGAAEHTISTPDVGTTYTATYLAVPKVESVAINDGNAQRSKVNGVTVVFNKPVVIDSGAFVLSGRGGAGSGTVLTASNPSSDGRTWTLTFAGDTVIGGSLADGIYDLTVVASKVHAADAPTFTMPADHAAEFHRLFSDADGDGDSDNGDMVRLRPTYSKFAGDPAFLWYWDYNNDGDVDNGDVLQVRSRRGVLFQNY